ncbi:MAG TPA: alpha/beta fold hydrolase, partial [Longimicrobiaceae bacterium]|nr:alpha/beta fold hydrolase [Longimicrobiaceae bacterium]
MSASRLSRTAAAAVLGSLRLAMAALGRVSPGAAARVAERLFATPRRRRPRPDPTAERLLARARPLEVAHGGGALRGHAWGSGPTVLLVHGWEATWASLAELVEPLVGRGFRVAAFDGPAHGASDGAQTDVLDYGRAVAEMVAAVGPVEAVVAHSFGAPATVVALGGW